MPDETQSRPERSPGIKLLFVGLVAVILTLPVLLIYALVYDRQDQSRTAQAAINAGWGGAQVLSGPIVVVPFRTTQTQSETVDGKQVSRVVEVERLLYISPVDNRVTTRIDPQERRKSIYRSVLFTAQVKGTATFRLPANLARFGVKPDRLLWDRAEVRVGTSDARGLTASGSILANGRLLEVQPGKGPAASGGQGFFAFLPWSGEGSLSVSYALNVRGSGGISLVPRGGLTRWTISSSWPSPSFSGSFLPDKPSISDAGFTASYAIDKLALGQPAVSMQDLGAPSLGSSDDSTRMIQVAEQPASSSDIAAGGAEEVISGANHAVSVDLIQPVNLYAKVVRSVKYGFLFIGFTFLAFFLFDVVGSARVAAVEYLLTGAGLVLFFALLLAFAEVIGFTLAYVLASAAVIGLLTAYSAAVLRSWARARFIGALLVGLYALLFVLLNLEAWSLLIGSILLFVALGGVMYATRGVDWGSVSRPRPKAEPAQRTAT
jgi:inner membrane protein